MRSLARVLAVAGALAPGPLAAPRAAAGAQPPPPAATTVGIQFAAFGPSAVDVLPGESVTWQNGSVRSHTVTADDGGFASDVLPPGAAFTTRFDAVGAFPYHCTIHAGMVGEVDVRAVTLDPLPVAPLPAGAPVQFTGRTADPGTPVRVELAAGAGVRPVASAVPSADGRWQVTAPVAQTGDYRATSAAGVSESRRLTVIDRRVSVRATRTGVAVTVTPALPYGHVLLLVDSREHFGWWPTARTRLDYVSDATFRLRRPARVRVALVGPDGWTRLVTSRTLIAPRPG